MKRQSALILAMVVLTVAFYHQVDQCEWCGEWIAGEADGTYLTGCSNCSGRLGWNDRE